MPQGAGYGSADKRGAGRITDNSASRTSTGSYNGQGRPNPAPTTSYGAPIHTTEGPTYGGIQVAKDPVHYAALTDQVNNYNNAATKWNASAQNPSVANLVNALAPGGFSMQAPNFNRPATYTSGDYHLGVNPMAAVAGLAGLAVPGAGAIAGPLAGAAYSAAGGPNLVLGGPSVPSAWGMNGGGASPSTATPGPSMASAGGNPTQGGMQAFPHTQQASAPGGAPFGAQPATPSMAAPAAPGFTAGVPNHTLPQNYTSRFPNSLTDQDKALLYAKALGGGMG